MLLMSSRWMKHCGLAAAPPMPDRFSALDVEPMDEARPERAESPPRPSGFSALDVEPMDEANFWRVRSWPAGAVSVLLMSSRWMKLSAVLALPSCALLRFQCS